MTMKKTCLATLVAAIAALAYQPLVAGEKVIKNGDKIVFMGDSITHYGVERSYGYVNLTVQGLAANGINVNWVGRGVPGEKASQMRARFQRDVLDFHPDVVTIAGGVNDIIIADKAPASGPEDVEAMIQMAQANNIKPVVMTPTFAAFSSENSDVSSAYAETVRGYAAKYGIPLGDNWQAVTDWRNDPTKPYLEYQLHYKETIDGVHMAPAGDRVMARTLLRALGLNDAEMANAEAAWNANERIYAINPAVKITPAQLATFKQAAANAGVGGGEFAKTVFKRGLASLAQNPTVEANYTGSDAESFSAGFSISMADYDTLLTTSMASAYQPADKNKGHVDATIGMAMLRGLRECEAGDPVVIVPQDVATNVFTRSIAFTTSGYTGSSTLTDFPVAVRLAANSPAGFSYADMADATSGKELRFADASGKSLDYDIEHWDATGTSLVWVKLPTLTKTTRFTMYYGGRPTDDVTASRTWSADYVGVWHMSEEDGAVSDASGNGLAASVDQASDGIQGASDGVFGKGRVNSANRNHTTGRAMLKVNDSYLLDLGNDFTLSSWVKMTATTDGSVARIACRGTDGDGNPEWEIGLTSDSEVKAYGGSGSSLTGTVPSVLNNWVHLVAVYSGTTLTVYANGMKAFEGAISEVKNSNNKLCFGSKGGVFNGHFTGLFDEFRLRDAVCSADWVKAEYAQAGTTFLSTGAVPEQEADDTPAPGGDGEGGEGEGGEGGTGAGEGGTGGEGEGTGEGEAGGEGESGAVTPTGDFTKAITFTTSGYQGTSTLENFPVLVKLSTAISGFDYADFGGTQNLVFKDAQGNVLPYEIESWNASGTSYVWVKLPAVTQTTTFTLYYSGSAVDGNVAGMTWTGADYVGVWHMDEADGDAVDATGHGLTAAQKGTTTSAQVSTAGAIGTARVNGTTSSKTFFEVANNALLNVGDSFTVSGWYNLSSVNAASQATVVGRQYGWFSTDGWLFELEKSDTTLTARGASNASNNMNLKGEMPSALNNWVHFALVYNGTSLTIYANGVPVETTGSINAAKNNSTAMTFGYANTRGYVYGSFDEFRLRDAVCSADWVKAEYAQAGSSFLANGGVTDVGTPEPAPEIEGVQFYID